MKRLWIMISLCSPTLLWAQDARITLRIEKSAGQPVKVIAPLDGQFFWGTIRTEMLDSTGTLQIENHETVPGVFTFYCNGSYSLYVRPGQNYLLRVNGNDKEKPFSIEAADAEGQLQLNAISREFYQSVGLAYYKTDTSFVRNKARVQASLDSSIRIFNALEMQGQIDKGFLELAIRKCRAYYASVLGATLIPPTQKLVFKKDSAAYDKGLIGNLQQRWLQLTKMCDVANVASTGPGEYLDYSNLFNTWYLGYIQGNLNGTFMKFKSGEGDYEEFQYDNIRQFYNGPIKEYVWASHLAYLLLDEKFQPVIPKEFKAFTAQYPGSHYTASMQPGMQRLLAYQQKASEDFTGQQHFVTGYDSIRTFNAITEKFKGKTVFLDLWATWCGPCKEEFAYNKELHTFLETKGIIPMYISIDRDQDDGRWKDMIKYYNLQGYHLRANAELMNDIRSLFGSNGSLTIPRYVLIKDRKIVGLHMKAPSEKEQLHRQIDGYLE